MPHAAQLLKVSLAIITDRQCSFTKHCKCLCNEEAYIRAFQWTCYIPEPWLCPPVDHGMISLVIETIFDCGLSNIMKLYS